MSNPLDRAARYLFAAVKRAAPTAKSAESFRITPTGDSYVIESGDAGTFFTVTGARHPLFGNRDAWYGPSGHQVGKKNFVNRAAADAAQVACEKFADDYIHQVITDSRVFSDVSRA